MFPTSRAGISSAACGVRPRRRALIVLALVSSLVLPALRPVVAKPALFPRPAQLEPDVQFWVRVYTQIDTNSGFLHDENDLSVVYETLHFEPNTSPRQRERQVDAARDRIVESLKRIATSGPQNAEDRRIRELWGDRGTPIRLLEATNHIRFQLGQSDRFRAGLERAGKWEARISEMFANLGLPPELAALPHVESSFNPAAYSKVGAAGLWQFMRSTGRRYMRVDSTVDDRLDPFRSSEAAAQLLSYNYHLLGTWPLAITAYNHGAAGVRHAVETLGTDDIVTILRDYKSPTFGFASRNFYVSFLAALQIDRDPEKYFGHLHRDPEVQFQEVVLPVRASVGTLERALHVDSETLRALNPALRPICWRGRRAVPRGYHLRLPDDGTRWTATLVAQRLGASAPRIELASDTESTRHRIARGETLASLAHEYGVSVRALARLNGLRPHARLRTGRYIRVPGEPAIVRVADSGSSSSGTSRTPERIATTPGTASQAAGAGAAAAAGTASVAEAVPSAAPSRASEAAGSADAGVYVVQSGDSLYEIASKVGVSESRLLALNHLPDPDSLFLGQRLRVSNAGQPSGSVEPAGDVAPAEAEAESDEDAQAVAAIGKPASKAQPVSAAQAEELGPALGPDAVEATATADPIDYSVGKNDTIVVAAAETLGHYADWLNVSASRLRRLNHMRYGRPVIMGHRIRLDFRHVTREAFETKRREYHRTLEATYFAAHHIEGTQAYIVRRGDSLWTVTQRYDDLPIWLLEQYNPDVDFSAMRPGTQIVVPRIEDAANAGG